MGSMQRPYKKVKLPRKRKKQAIKAQGRKWYYDTIRLYYITQKSGRFYEPVCKFWKHSSLKPSVFVGPKGQVGSIMAPTQYW